MMDQQIFVKPKCPCGDDAFVLYGTVFVCGPCALKLTKKEQERQALFVMEALKNDSKDLPSL